MSKPCLVHEGALRGPYLPKQVGDVLCLCTRVTECLPTRRASERVVFRRGTADASGSAWSARARAGPHATVCLSLEPNGRRAARLVTALVQAKRAMNASGWLEAVPHPPRAAGRPRGAARLAIRASITIVAWRARSCSQATRRRPKPSRRRPASDAPAWAPRPHPRCKTGRGCDTGPQRRKDDNPTAGHEQLCGACGLNLPRARRPLTTKEAFVSNRSATVAAAKRLMRQRPPATRRRRPS